jgi:hypothetical protein
MTTPAAVGAQIVERTYYKLENLTLDLAPTACRPETDTPDGFARHTIGGCRLHQVWDSARFRLIEVALVTPTQGQNAMSSVLSSFAQLLRIRAGYPLDEKITISGTEYLVEELRQSDFEQIDRAVVGGALGAAIDVDHPVISVNLVGIAGGSQSFGGRCTDIFYGVQYDREYTA